jgi:hypothetical protein
LAAPQPGLAPASRTSHGFSPVQLQWAVLDLMLLRTVAICCCCLALGSYVAVVLALEALLQSTLSLVSLALEDLALPPSAATFFL